MGLGLLVAILLWGYFVGFSARQSGNFFNNGNNAVWLGHEWVDDLKSDKEIQELVESLKKHQIGTVFVHVGPLNADGSVDLKTHRFADHFVKTAKQFSKEIHYEAWIGQLRGKIKLEDEKIRQNIANQSYLLVKIIGFDGIHFDIEPVWDGDLDFIKLLKTTRGLLGKDYSISVALAEFIPKFAVKILENFKEMKNYNSEVIYKNVAKYADYVVVMAYDTGIKSSWFYRLLIKEETIWLTKVLDGKKLFVGIPAYDEANENFHPKIENVENGVRGVINGLNNIRSNEKNFMGIAIYPYWQISAEEWAIFDKLWLQ